MKNIAKAIVTLTLLASLLVAIPQIAGATLAQDRQAQRITNLKARGDQEINRRLVVLQHLNTKIDSLKHITSDQKASFKQQINQNISDLTTLKTKIDGDTDLLTLQTDVRSIVSSYRIFALFIPKIYLLASADRASEVDDLLTAISAKLQVRLDQAANNGKNVTDLKERLADMNAKIADAKAKIQDLNNTVPPLTPDGYPGNKTVLQSARAELQTIRLDLVTARQDARQVVKGLKDLGTNP